MGENIWKLQDAKARFSEVVRKARDGEPQEVTVHGKRAVAVVDLDRFEVRKKEPGEETMAGFMEQSTQYRGLDLKIPPRTRNGGSEVMTTAEFIERSKQYRGLGLKIPSRTKTKLQWDAAFEDDES
jgi:antitoxin Phd